MTRQPSTATADGLDYRLLRFESLEDLEAEVDRLVAADAEGRLRSTGNWTLGQTLAHIAAWIEYGYEGYPIKPLPRVVQWLMRLRLRKVVHERMPRGVKIPGVAGGTVGTEVMETSDAAERLSRAIDRLRRGERARYPSPAFGEVAHDDWIGMHLRHAELHLGYLSPVA